MMYGIFFWLALGVAIGFALAAGLLWTAMGRRPRMRDDRPTNGEPALDIGSGTNDGWLGLARKARERWSKDNPW